MKGRPLGAGRRRGAAGIAAAALAFGASTGEAAAEKIRVTNTAEKGRGSFAAAVRKADADKDRDVITFGRRLRGTIRIPDQVDFTHPVAIEGRGYGRRESGAFGRVSLKGPRRGTELYFDGVGKATIRGLHLDRVRVSAYQSRVDLMRSHVTGEGTASGNGFYADSYSDSRIDRSTITGWQRGVFAYRSDIEIDRSLVSANKGGGGVVNAGYDHARITNSTISGNSVVSNGPIPASGGGVRAGYESSAEVVNSTISGNVAEGTDSYGGGVAGYVEVNESTITGNRAARGGGVGSRADYFYEVTIANTIVAGNESLDPTAGEDCDDGLSPPGESIVQSHGGNLVQSPGSCSLRGSDLSGVDPLLGALADNGGPTPTFALRRRSPAIGLAIRRTATARDQRCVNRDDDPDSGAFERRRPPAR